MTVQPAPRTKLLVLTAKPEGLSPGQRFRLEQWAPHLRERHGISMDFLPFESPALTRILYQRGKLPQKAGWLLYDFARRAVAVARARQFDAVVIYREASMLGPAFYEHMLSQLKIPTIVDFDDAIWIQSEHVSANGIFSRLRFPSKTSTLCRIASAVTVGNDYLAAYARARNAMTYVVPTSIDLDSYPVQPEIPSPSEQDDQPFVVTWSGSTSTLHHFEQARVALERLARRRRLQVRVICNQAPASPIAFADNVFVPWSSASEAEDIGKTHVGIMPLADEPYMHGKCGLKALQYMATGRPVVLSPVGVNSVIVSSGRNGILASTTEEWVNALDQLAEDAELRRTLGQEGRRTVEQSYCKEVTAERFADVVFQVLEQSTR